MTNPELNRPGILYTFYSYKGGTGRTMALANVATLLAKWGHSVLVVDWDLEAPGLERYFSDRVNAQRVRASYTGVVDLIVAHSQKSAIDWRKSLVELDNGVSLITAGQEDGNYFERMQKLDFERLFSDDDLGSYIEKLRNEWLLNFDFVLIDSRTGLTDIGGICTVHLPDILVVLFTATDSSTDGSVNIISRARKAHERLPLDRGTLSVLPVPARDESRTEYQRAATWKNIFASRFGEFYREWLPKPVSVEEAIETLRLPYVPYWSFGESLPVQMEGTRDPGSLGYAYETLARLLSTKLEWYSALEGKKLPPSPLIRSHEISQEWIERQRTSAEVGLRKSGRTGFMEVYHFCENELFQKNQRELLAISRQAAVHTFGWPIGAVLDRADVSPQAVNDGIVANIHSMDFAYDYWSLTKAGDFYTLLSLFEDEREKDKLYYNTRIIRVTEAVLHAINLYKLFGASPSATIVFSLMHGGLKGRSLGSTTGGAFLRPSSNGLEDQVTSPTVRFQLSIDEPEICNIVKQLCEPLFMVFSFSFFSDETYAEIIRKFIQGRV